MSDLEGKPTSPNVENCSLDELHMVLKEMVKSYQDSIKDVFDKRTKYQQEQLKKKDQIEINLQPKKVLETTKVEIHTAYPIRLVCRIKDSTNFKKMCTVLRKDQKELFSEMLDCYIKNIHPNFLKKFHVDLDNLRNRETCTTKSIVDFTGVPASFVHYERIAGNLKYFYHGIGVLYFKEDVLDWTIRRAKKIKDAKERTYSKRKPTGLNYIKIIS